MNRKRVILAALLGAFAVSLVYAYLAMPRLEKAPPKANEPRGSTMVRATDEQGAAKAQDRIDFDFMVTEPQDFPGAQRDIFRFAPQRPVRTAPPVAVAPPPVVKPVEPPKPVEVVEAPKQPLSTFTYLGFLNKAGEVTVFLSSGGQLFLVTQGENFGVNNEFVVENIYSNALEVRDTRGNQQLTIPLVEHQKLRNAVSAPARREPRPEVSIPQPRARILKSRTGTPQEDGEPLPEATDENISEESIPVEAPAEGDAIEGDVNGTNQ